MKKIIILAVAGILAGTAATSAQQTVLLGSTNDDAVKVLSYNSTMVGDNVNFDFVLNYDNLLLDSREQFVATPFITDGVNSVDMAPVVFMGPKAFKKHSRKNTLYGQNEGEKSPYEIVVFSKKELREIRRASRNGDSPAESMGDLTREKSIRYNASFPYQSWMDGSTVALHHDIEGYRGQEYAYNTELGTLINRIPPVVAFIVPEPEPVKVRKDHMTAHINFKVNETTLQRDIFSNAAELDDIYRFADNVIGNNDVEVRAIALRGYASPEGNYKHNDDLATERVENLRNDLSQKYNLDKSLISVSHIAEDWDSVANWVAASDMKYKNEVLNIIRETAEPDARDAKIRALDGGKTYATLLNDVYPGLRRVDYDVEYSVVPFTAERGRQVILTNPQHLSLNEFYHVAVTYPVDSQEYMDVFDTAVRYFPEDHVANHNVAAMAISKMDYDKARRHIEKCDKEHAQTLNNLGILYLQDGNYDKAEEAFRKAMESGSQEAGHNYRNLSSLTLVK